MSNRDDTLDIFLQKLDAINSFCESRGDESQHACDGCILSDYCVDIPTRESYKAAVKSTDKCMELISRVKDEIKELKEKISRQKVTINTLADQVREGKGDGIQQ